MKTFKELLEMLATGRLVVSLDKHCKPLQVWIVQHNAKYKQVIEFFCENGIWYRLSDADFEFSLSDGEPED
jgi:hypothetical protein